MIDFSEIQNWIFQNDVPQRVLVRHHMSLHLYCYPQPPEKGEKEKNASVPTVDGC